MMKTMMEIMKTNIDMEMKIMKTNKMKIMKTNIDMEMEHRMKQHSRILNVNYNPLEGDALILNENYNPREGDLCYACGILLLHKSCVYSCSRVSNVPHPHDCANFFLHKSCAHLPGNITHPNYPGQTFYIYRFHDKTKSCSICRIKLNRFFYLATEHLCLCLTCAIPLKNYTIVHPSHSHPLTFLDKLATLECEACHTLATGFSYMGYTCQFWIHDKCFNLPNFLECNHKHPLKLAYSLPEAYCKFDQFCTICKQDLAPRHWLYFCANCRFFAHVKCATSSAQISKLEGEADFDELNLVHLPTSDELSLNLMMQQFIKETIISLGEEDTDVAPPDHIHHWAHQQHSLVLKNKSAIIMDNYTSQKLADAEEEIMLICDGCTRSISSKNDVFYECSRCNFFLHRYCAQFPREMLHHDQGKMLATRHGVKDYWACRTCFFYSNGIRLNRGLVDYHLDCACLPKAIKHEAHHHPLKQVKTSDDYFTHVFCKSCNETIFSRTKVIFGCTSCNFYIHGYCALLPRTRTHRWDPHPLSLILSPEEVTDHPHEFVCETCSEEINTNQWFYHCSECDLSFHIQRKCMNPLLYKCSRFKFGVTNIKNKAHRHGLTFVQHKKKRQPCKTCRNYITYGEAVLECVPCKFIMHAREGKQIPLWNGDHP